jgi:hypothetical protein
MALLDDDLAAFLEGDTAQCVATVAADGEPTVGRAWGLQVERNASRVRAVVGADVVTVANLTARTPPSRVALTASDVRTYRTVQLKGTCLAVEPATARDRDVHDRYRHEFAAAIRAVGATTPLEAVWPDTIVAVVLAVDALFDQTPGPGAGRPVGAGA